MKVLCIGGPLNRKYIIAGVCKFDRIKIPILPETLRTVEAFTRPFDGCKAEEYSLDRVKNDATGEEIFYLYHSSFKDGWDALHYLFNQGPSQDETS